MGILCTPIDVEGSRLCIDHTLESNLARITTPVRTGADPYVAGYGVEYNWHQFANEYLESGGSMDVERWVWHVMNGASGGISFGLGCGVAEIVLRFRGFLRVLLGGQDDITVYLNGAPVWSAAADTTAGQNYWNTNYGVPATVDTDVYPYYEGSAAEPLTTDHHDLTITIPEGACGNVISIIGGQDTTNWPASNPASWYAQIISIS